MNIRHLPLVGSLVFSGLLTLGACGSSSPAGSGGTPGLGGLTGAAGGHVGAAGGTTGATGGATGAAGGTTGTTGSCATIPSCLQVIVSCLPSGTCVQQMTGAVTSGSFQYNSCYSNGVKESTVESFDLTTGATSFTATYTKSGSVCFSESFADSGAGGAGANDNPVITIKNGAGTAVATLSESADGNSTLVTCPGQAPVALPDDCMPAGMTSTTTGDCTDGTCP